MARLFLRTCLIAALLAGGAAPALRAEPPRPTTLRPQLARALWDARLPASGLLSQTPLGGVLGPADRDHRYTGFFVGAGFGLAATVFSVAWCSDHDNACSSGRALLLGPLVTVTLGLGGAVIGGLFPKPPVPASTPRQTWSGQCSAEPQHSQGCEGT